MLSFTKEYLRIDFTDDDALLTVLEAMAVDYIKNATGYTVDDTVKDFDKLVLAMVVGHFYENRQAIVATGAVPQFIPMTLQSLFTQLQRKQEGIDAV